MLNKSTHAVLGAAVVLLVGCGGGGGGSGPSSGSGMDMVMQPEPLETEPTIQTHTVAAVSGEEIIRILKSQSLDGTFNGLPGIRPWQTRPIVQVESSADAGFHRNTAFIVDMFNDWLPVHRRMIMDKPTDRMPSGCVLDSVAPTCKAPPGIMHVTSRVPGGFAVVRGYPATEWAVVTARPNDVGRYGPTSYGLIIHEMFHGLGFHGHNDFRGESVIGQMSNYPEKYGEEISRLDGEMLMTAYSLLEPGYTDADITPEAFGPWATVIPATSVTSGDISFGVEYRTQWVRAWDKGPVPESDLRASGLSGTVTWDGQMVGYTNAGTSVNGGATVEVDMATLDGVAVFDNLQADFEVIGNRMNLTDDDPLWMGFDGQFRGSEHEAVTGAFKYDTLTAAFGATRNF